MVQSQLVPQTPVEVLAPELDMTSLLAKTAEIEELFKIAFIPTERASQYFRWLDELRLLNNVGRRSAPAMSARPEPPFIIELRTPSECPM